MANVTIVNENGEVEAVEVTTGGVVFEIDDGEMFRPAVVERLEYDHEGIVSQMTWDSCNRVENRREGDRKPDVVIEGIITEEQLEPLKGLDQQQDLTILSDLHNGPVAVRRTTIEQSNDLVEFIPDGGEPSLAFAYQLQIRVSQHEDSVATVPMENTVFADVADEVVDE